MTISDDKTGQCTGCSHKITWWAMLVVAVLAVPSLGIIISYVSGVQGFMQIAVFIITCWISTYLGMRLMNKGR